MISIFAPQFRPRIVRALVERLSGPGGLYNIGNAIGLIGGPFLVLWSTRSPDAGLSDAAAAVASYLAGSGSAVALTAATLVFFWSGEAYHRAWAAPRGPDPALCRWGDLLSAIGALALGVALALVGHPLLAATAGLLHAIGKLGSALHRSGDPALPGWPQAWPDPFRSAVLLSRVPATLVAAEALATALPGIGLDGAVPAIVEPGVLLVCYALWSKADLMLFRPAASGAI